VLPALMGTPPSAPPCAPARSSRRGECRYLHASRENVLEDQEPGDTTSQWSSNQLNLRRELNRKDMRGSVLQARVAGGYVLRGWPKPAVPKENLAIRGDDHRLDGAKVGGIVRWGQIAPHLRAVRKDKRGVDLQHTTRWIEGADVLKRPDCRFIVPLLTFLIQGVLPDGKAAEIGERQVVDPASGFASHSSPQYSFAIGSSSAGKSEITTPPLSVTTISSSMRAAEKPSLAGQ
jgi:hypothetical protein